MPEYLPLELFHSTTESHYLRLLLGRVLLCGESTVTTSLLLQLMVRVDPTWALGMFPPQVGLWSIVLVRLQLEMST